MRERKNLAVLVQYVNKKKHSSYREMQTNDLFGILKGAMIFHAISIPNSELGDNTTI